jgi:hypothetical protein
VTKTNEPAEGARRGLVERKLKTLMRLSDYRRSNKTDVDPPSTIDASSARHDAGRNGPAVARGAGSG